MAYHKTMITSNYKHVEQACIKHDAIMAFLIKRDENRRISNARGATTKHNLMCKNEARQRKLI